MFTNIIHFEILSVSVITDLLWPVSLVPGVARMIVIYFIMWGMEDRYVYLVLKILSIKNSRITMSDVGSVPVWCCSGENECEYLNWALAGLLSPRASRDWTQGLLTHETPSLYHLLFKISAALEYVFRAAMILYNLVTSCHGCQPWTFIHPGPGLDWPGTIWNYPRWIIRTKLYQGKHPRGQSGIITLLNFHFLIRLGNLTVLSYNIP